MMLVVERLSPVMLHILEPSSRMRLRPFGPQDPMVLIDMGVKWYFQSRSLYFWIFLRSASSAAFPASREVEARWLSAKVSGHVKSQTRWRPCLKGKIVHPSGRFPSLRLKPRGSSSAVMFADPGCWHNCVVEFVPLTWSSSDRGGHIGQRWSHIYICEVGRRLFRAGDRTKFVG